MRKLQEAIPASVAGRALVVSTTAAALFFALQRRNHRALVTLLRHGARRPLTSASVPAALAILLAAQKALAARAREREESGRLALTNGDDNAAMLMEGADHDRFSVLSRIAVPRVLSHPLDSVRAFAAAQAAAANRGWGHVQDFWNVRTSRIGGRMQAGIEGTLTRSTDALAERILAALKADPDMPILVQVCALGVIWPCVSGATGLCHSSHLCSHLQSFIDGTFAEVMPTVRQRVLRKADELLFTPMRRRLRRRRAASHGYVDDHEQTLAAMPWRARARARLLYGMDPHDKSIWRCLKSKRWWALHLIGVVPVVGPVWWVLVFLMKDRTDEFQLVRLRAGRVIGALLA